MATKKDNHVSALQKTNIDAAMRLAQLSIENSQRVMEIQVSTAKRLFEEGLANATAISAVSDPKDAMELRARFAKNTTEQMLGCARQIADITTAAQAELRQLVSAQLNTGNADMHDAMQKLLLAMPGTDKHSLEAMQTALEMMRSAFEQVARASNDAFSALTQQTGKGSA